MAKKGLAKLAAQTSKRAGSMSKQAKNLMPKRKPSVGARITRALPKGAGALAGAAGTLAASRAAQKVGTKVRDKLAEPGSIKEKATDGVKELVGNGDDGASQVKLREIIQEYIDVSVPADFAYEQWRRFEDLSDVFKGVEWVQQESKKKLQWTAKIGPVKRRWSSEIKEERPGERIEWASTGGAKNAGVVAFHPLEDNLTRIMIQMEYHPRGFVENVGNLLRIQRRRVRRDLRLFKHHVEIKAGPPPDKTKSSSRGNGEGDKRGNGNGNDKRGNGSSEDRTTTRYEERPMDQLLKRAAELDIEGRSNMNKEQLIEALRSK